MAFFDRLFGRKKPETEEAAKLRREMAVQQERAKRADREAEAAAKLGRELGRAEMRAQAAAAARGPAQRQREREAQELRAKVLEQGRRERIAREAAAKARRDAAVLEGQLSMREQTQAAARESLFQQRIATGEGQRYLSKKQFGTGDIPERNEFLLLGVPFSRFASSNVKTLVYDRRNQTLYVEFIRKGGGSWYAVASISPSEAYEFYVAGSKGVLYWQRVRVRGKGNAGKSKKPVQRVSGPPADLPIDPNSNAGQYILQGGAGL